MRRVTFAEMDCSVARTLDLVGERWTLLVIRDVFLGVNRFERLQGRLGIARNILADRLDQLVEAEILERLPYQGRPARFDYRLTRKGVDLFPILTALRQWGDKWTADGEPPLSLVHLDCGHEAWVVQKCSHCDGEVTSRNVRSTGRQALLGRSEPGDPGGGVEVESVGELDRRPER